MRYITVFTMVIGCIVMYGYHGADWDIREWKPSEFGNLFGIGVFSFLMHHSIP